MAEVSKAELRCIPACCAYVACKAAMADPEHAANKTIKKVHDYAPSYCSEHCAQQALRYSQMIPKSLDMQDLSKRVSHCLFIRIPDGKKYRDDEYNDIYTKLLPKINTGFITFHYSEELRFAIDKSNCGLAFKVERVNNKTLSPPIAIVCVSDNAGITYSDIMRSRIRVSGFAQIVLFKHAHLVASNQRYHQINARLGYVKIPEPMPEEKKKA